MSRPVRMALVAVLPALFGALSAEREVYEFVATLAVLWAGCTLLVAVLFFFIEQGRE